MTVASTAGEIVQMVSPLRALAAWPKRDIERLLLVAFKRDPRAPLTHKQYISNKNKWLEKATFLHPTYGAVGDIHTCAWQSTGRSTFLRTPLER